MFHDANSKASAGILCLHVDDLLLGGCGTAYRQTVNALNDNDNDNDNDTLRKVQPTSVSGLALQA